MGDFAQGIKAFKKGMSEDEKTAEAKSEPIKTIDSRRQRIQDRSSSVAPRACAPDRCACARGGRRRLDCRSGVHALAFRS